jgi:hypothetical protein
MGLGIFGPARLTGSGTMTLPAANLIVLIKAIPEYRHRIGRMPQEYFLILR